MITPTHGAGGFSPRGLSSGAAFSPCVDPRGLESESRQPVPARRDAVTEIPTQAGPATRLRIAAGLILYMLVPLACSPPAGGDGGADNDNGGTSTVRPDGFPTASKVNFEPINRLIVDGEILEANDVAVFDVGPLSLGDRVEVLCIARSGSSLDPMSAMFDVDGFRVFWNDDINAGTSNFDSAFDGVIRHDSSHYFLAVTSTNFFATTGPFRCTLQLFPGVAVAPIIGQTVVLQLNETIDVTVAGMPNGDLPAFDAAAISDAFAGDTEDMKDLILEIVRRDFEQFDVEILTTDDDEPDKNFTSIFFGLSSTQSIFGIADDIDFYNADDMDNAILFLESFSGLSTDLTAMAQAIGNVVSHEIGHTLGLMHTSDVTMLMDNTGEDVTLLVDQSFGAANVFDFPIGKQNAPLLLAETVGRAVAKSRSFPEDGQWRCGTCGATLSLIADTANASAN